MPQAEEIVERQGRAQAELLRAALQMLIHKLPEEGMVTVTDLPLERVQVEADLAMAERSYLPDHL